MLKAVLFDMDGVIFDTERLGARLLAEAAAEHGYAVDDALYTDMLGVPYEPSRAVFQRRFGPDVPFDAIMDGLHRRFAQADRDGATALKDGARECLEGLRERGIRMALATSTQRDTVLGHFERMPELWRCFSVTLCGGEVARGKPAPDIYLAAAAALGARPEECLGVEDSYNGLRALSAAGIRSVMIPDMLPHTPEIAPCCTYLLPSLRALCPLVDKLRAM